VAHACLARSRITWTLAYWIFLVAAFVFSRWFFLAAVPCFVCMWIGWVGYWRGKDLDTPERHRIS
jgi:hypothetical protein